MIFLNFLTPFSHLTMMSFLAFPLQQNSLESSILLSDFYPPSLPSDHCGHHCCPIYLSTKTSLSAILCGSALPSPMAIFRLQFSIHHTTVTVHVSLLHKTLSFFFFPLAFQNMKLLVFLFLFGFSCEHFRHLPTSEILYLLLYPECCSPGYTWISPSRFIVILECYLFSKAFCGHLFKITTPHLQHFLVPFCALFFT